MINNKLTYISLFSSAGVGCYGFKKQNYECIATNELIERRLNIQKINNKCKFESGYIQGDIKSDEVKQKICLEIEKWKLLGNDDIDVVVATPPCQGMSVANHKKNEADKNRNSLIVESVSIVKLINPKFFIFENVSAFWKTRCIDKSEKQIPIGEMVLSELGDKYVITNKIINFKNYGSQSSRTRTLVIGVRNDFKDFISPLELYPDYVEEKTLFENIGHLKSLQWGEYDINDFFHSFRIYPKHMREWISELEQGKSAFDNIEPSKIPHRIINGKFVPNKSKNGDKYTRQCYSKIAPCIHTRNDQLASQNTVHPIDDRVFSIRELMILMSIPFDFKWIEFDLEELNSLSVEEKKKISKKEEMNIRQSIGEAVPTNIFEQIARKIKEIINSKRFKKQEIQNIIKKNNLTEFKNLFNYINDNLNVVCRASLSSIVEMANINRNRNSAYFTNKFIINEIIKELPDFQSEEITIIEPSVGIGNFLPLLFKKYENKKNVNIKLVDIDSNMLELVKLIYGNCPSNISLEYIHGDFLGLNIEKVDLIIGNPPFTKLSAKESEKYIINSYNKDTTNLSAFFLEKALLISNYISLVLPKNILNTPEYDASRQIMKKNSVDCVIDFGEKGFSGVLIETINVFINTKLQPTNTKVVSVTRNEIIQQKSDYIFDNKLPYWIIYRNKFFDSVYRKMTFNIFNPYRDRQLTNSNTKQKNNCKDIRVIKSRNINDYGTEILNIPNYDAYVDYDILKKCSVYKYIDREDVFLVPNMTYNPRIIKKPANCVTNGSVAILCFNDSNDSISQYQLRYISSSEYRKFYRIARNYQTRSLNIDSNSCYWFGKVKELQNE